MTTHPFVHLLAGVFSHGRFIVACNALPETSTRLNSLDFRSCGKVGVAWFVGRSVGLYVTIVSRAKTAEPMEMLFGM